MRRVESLFVESWNRCRDLSREGPRSFAACVSQSRGAQTVASRLSSRRVHCASESRKKRRRPEHIRKPRRAKTLFAASVAREKRRAARQPNVKLQAVRRKLSKLGERRAEISSCLLRAHYLVCCLPFAQSWSRREGSSSPPPPSPDC